MTFTTYIKTKSLTLNNNIFLTEEYFNKKTNVNNSISNNMTKINTISITGNIPHVKHDYSYNTYVSNNYKSQIAYVGHNLYKSYDNRTFNNTSNIHKHINQYSTDVFNNCKINKTHSVKQTYYNCTKGVVINKHNTINTNDTHNITNNNKLFNNTDNNYYTKKNFNTSHIANNITRHNHNNYAHNVIKNRTYTYKTY